MSKLVITGSSMGLLQTCARNYKLRYVDGIESITRPSYFTLGSAFHAAVEEFRRGGSLGDMMTAGMDPDLSKDDTCRLQAMVEAYHTRYKNERGTFDSIEEEFKKPWRGAWSLCGVVDAIKGGVIYETKTVGRIDGAYLERLWQARQTLIYCAVMEVNTVIYDLVEKSGIRRYKATPVEKRKYVTDKETGQRRLNAKQREYDEPDADYLTRLREWYVKHPEALHREEIIYSEIQLKDIWDDIDAEVRRLQWHMKEDVWPRSLNSCHRYNNPCEFAPLCGSGGSKLVLDTHYQSREKIHSELKGETSDSDTN
jgi:hypothetical protein